ncbi:MAG: SAM-dependent methyltransferase, partial [Actinobacteria bacterium]|nr:SAM-dependent methyltransferase [Actinomycetota bacterium]
MSARRRVASAARIQWASGTLLTRCGSSWCNSTSRQTLSYAAAQAPAFHQTLAYLIVERSPALIRRQQETLER